jgi:hypothetical protein
MEVIRSSETSVHIRITQRYIPEDGNFHNCHFENLKSYIVLYRIFQKKIYNDIPNVNVWRALRKGLQLKEYKLPLFQDIEQWLVCTPLTVNFFVKIATLEYHCEAFSKTPRITNGSRNEP